MTNHGGIVVHKWRVKRVTFLIKIKLCIAIEILNWFHDNCKTYSCSLKHVLFYIYTGPLINRTQSHTLTLTAVQIDGKKLRGCTNTQHFFHFLRITSSRASSFVCPRKRMQILIQGIWISTKWVELTWKSFSIHLVRETQLIQADSTSRQKNPVINQMFKAITATVSKHTVSRGNTTFRVVGLQSPCFTTVPRWSNLIKHADTISSSDELVRMPT